MKGAGFCSLYREIHYYEIHYNEIWVYFWHVTYQCATSCIHKSIITTYSLYVIAKNWMISLCLQRTNVQKMWRRREEGNRTFKSQRNFSSLQAENKVNFTKNELYWWVNYIACTEQFSFYLLIPSRYIQAISTFI